MHRSLVTCCTVHTSAAELHDTHLQKCTATQRRARDRRRGSRRRILRKARALGEQVTAWAVPQRADATRGWLEGHAFVTMFRFARPKNLSKKALMAPTLRLTDRLPQTGNDKGMSASWGLLPTHPWEGGGGGRGGQEVSSPVWEGGGRGIWDPKVCVPTMARQDFPDCKFRCFQRWSLWCGGGGGGGGLAQGLGV